MDQVGVETVSTLRAPGNFISFLEELRILEDQLSRAIFNFEDRLLIFIFLPRILYAFTK